MLHGKADAKKSATAQTTPTRHAPTDTAQLQSITRSSSIIRQAVNHITAPVSVGGHFKPNATNPIAPILGCGSRAEWDDTTTFPSFGTNTRYCVREIALEKRLRQLRQTYIVPSDNVCIASREQDSYIRPFVFDGLGKLRPLICGMA